MVCPGRDLRTLNAWDAACGANVIEDRRRNLLWDFERAGAGTFFQARSPNNTVNRFRSWHDPSSALRSTDTSRRHQHGVASQTLVLSRCFGNLTHSRGHDPAQTDVIAENAESAVIRRAATFRNSRKSCTDGATVFSGCG
jgi:hypothetical protein